MIRETADPPVLLVDGKGGRERIVPMSDLVIMELQSARALTKCRGYVFPRLDGQPGGNAPHMVSQLCNRYLHGLGITESLHKLRHRAGTRLYAVSQDLRMVQDILGHESPSTTANYVAWSNAAAVDALRQIAEPALGGRAPKAVLAPKGR